MTQSAFRRKKTPRRYWKGLSSSFGLNWQYCRGRTTATVPYPSHWVGSSPLRRSTAPTYLNCQSCINSSASARSCCICCICCICSLSSVQDNVFNQSCDENREFQKSSVPATTTDLHPTIPIQEDETPLELDPTQPTEDLLGLCNPPSCF